MWYAYRYRAYPDWTGVTADAERHIDIHRQLYNHVKHDYEHSPDDDKPSEYDQNNKLPEWKQKWELFGEIHSKAAQETVARSHENLASLKREERKRWQRGAIETPITLGVSV